MRLARNAVAALAAMAVFGARGVASQLPVRSYTTADGPPRNPITCLVPDSKGFLWLCTTEGLARFDGYEFQTYGADQGLPDPVVNTFLETRSGRLVAGTNKGLAVLKPRVHDLAASRFDVYSPFL